MPDGHQLGCREKREDAEQRERERERKGNDIIGPAAEGRRYRILI